MGWRSTLVLTALVIAVAAYLWFADQPPAPSDQSGTGQRQPANAQSAQALRRLLIFEPADVIGIQLQRAGETRTVRQEDGTWQGIEDPAAVNDFLHTLSELRVLMDLSVSTNELADYGLDPPAAVLSLQLRSRVEPLVLQIGERNPATTGVYVRNSDNGAVTLAGALVEWEFDQLFRRLSAGG